jgi:hypothetical protein
MSQSEDQTHNNTDDEFVCSDCGKEVKEDYDFCPRCGSILSEGIFCDKHRHVAAVGVCVVCGVLCCDECGSVVNDAFRCAHHVDYEIFEGMVKVYGTHEEADAEFTKSRLEEAGLHPALFHLRRSMDRGHVEYEIYKEGENFNASEIRVMVPCEEVAEAETFLKSTPESG